MIKKNTIPGMRNFFLYLVFILSAGNCFAQFADTSQLNNYVRDTIKDRRPAKVTALQVQKALLGTSNLFATKADKTALADSAATLRSLLIGTTPSLQDVLDVSNYAYQNIQLAGAGSVVSVTDNETNFAYALMNAYGEIELANAAGKSLKIAATNQTSPLGPGTPNIILMPDRSCTLLERTFKEYRARIFQTGTSAPAVQYAFIDEISNGTIGDALFRSIAITRTGVGTYKCRIRYGSSATVTAGIVDLSFSDGKIRSGGIGNGSDGASSYADFDFTSYDLAGAPADGIINYANIYIRIY